MEGERPLTSKAKLTEVNSYLTCPLCKGYYIDATTIVECLHSFCRSCIIQHLQQDNYCPICELMINTAKPNIKPDKTLQDIVYKLVPGLYASEMTRRRRFWADRPEEASKVSCPEARGLMTERIIFSPQDAISLSIEYTSDEPAAATATVAWQRSEPDPEVPLRRYLQCPAMLRVEHLKKFICNKYNVDSLLYHVDILYKRVPLPGHYTLMDIAYIYTWKRNEPMKFFFRITDIALVSERFDYFEPSSKQTTRCQQQRSKQQTINNNNIEKKSVSLVRQPAKNNGTSSDIKTCDSDKQLKNELSDKQMKNELSDKQMKNEISDKCSDKHEKDVRTDQKCGNIKSCSDNSKEIITRKDYSKSSDNSGKQISENNVKVKQEKSVVQTMCEVKMKNESNVKNTTENSKPDIKNTPEVPIKHKSELEIKQENSPKTKPTETEIEPKEPTQEDTEKSQFLMSIQLTAKNASPPKIKNSSPPALKPLIPDLIRAKLPAQKRKYVRKNEKSPNSAKKPKLTENKPELKKLDTKIRKIASKDAKPSEEQGLKIKNIKNPIVRLMVSNLNKQANNLTKIVGQADGSKFEQNEQKLQSLIDSCKLNIPSSLSITLTESPRNEDGTIAQSKPAAIKPVQNYIEILKLPDKNVPESGKPNETLPETSKTLEDEQKTSALNRSQKHTFQTMFEETIKRDESMKAQLFQIQNQAKSLEMAKKTANCIKINIPKTVKKQQNALDLSTSPKSDTSSPNSNQTTNPNNFLNKTPSQNMSQRNSPSSISPNPTNKRNILEIAHQLSKRSRIESETLKVPTPNSTVVPKISPNPSCASPRSNTVSPKPNMSPKPSMSPNPISMSPKPTNMCPNSTSMSPTPTTMTPKTSTISHKSNSINHKSNSINHKSNNMSYKSGSMSPRPNMSPKPSSMSLKPTSMTSNPTSMSSNPTSISTNSTSISPKPSMSPKLPSMSPKPNSMNSHSTSISSRSASMSPRSASMSPHPVSMSPHPSSMSPHPSSMSPRSSCMSPNPSSMSPKPSISPNPSSISPKLTNMSPKPNNCPNPNSNSTSPPKQIIINSNFSSGGSMSIKRSPKKMPIPRLPISKVPTPKLNPPNIRNSGLLKFSNYTAKLANTASVSNTNPPKSPIKSPNGQTKTEVANNTIQGLTPNQILEKYNITNLAQFNANLNQAQFAFQQALMVTHQLEMHRMQQNSQKHWMTNPNILAHYENYVQSLKNQQNQIIGNSSKN